MYVGPCWEQRLRITTDSTKNRNNTVQYMYGCGPETVAHAATRSHRANCDDSAGMNISGQFYLRNANKQNERAITHPNWTVPPPPPHPTLTPHAMPALTVLHIMTRHGSVFPQHVLPTPSPSFIRPCHLVVRLRNAAPPCTLSCNLLLLVAPVRALIKGSFWKSLCRTHTRISHYRRGKLTNRWHKALLIPSQKP